MLEFFDAIKKLIVEAPILNYPSEDHTINLDTDASDSTKLLPIYDGPFLVTRVLSPVLIEIEGQNKKKIIHHDKLKICRDRCFPLWIRRRRQELLSLDDTLPYDEAEHSLLGDAGLDLTIMRLWPLLHTKVMLLLMILVLL